MPTPQLKTLSPSQIRRFLDLAGQLEKASPSEARRLLATEKDSAVRQWLELDGLWGREPVLDVGSLPHGTQFGEHKSGGESKFKYTLKRQLGSGAFGVVYEADQHLGSASKTVAVKFLRPEYCVEPFLGLFRAEIDRLLQVAPRNHPGLAEILDTGELPLGAKDSPPMAPYLVTRFVEGRPLDQHAADLPRWEDRVRLFCEVCSAVQELHAAGLIHGDLKPANVRVTPRGLPVVLDFGLARVHGVHAPAFSIGGTLAYSAPEQLAEPPVIDQHIDVYALGVILFESLTLHSPYASDPATGGALEDQVRQGKVRPLCEVQSDLPQPLDAAVAKALARDPAHRHANPDAFRRALLAVLNGRKRARSPRKPTRPSEAGGQHIVVRRGAKVALIINKNVGDIPIGRF